MQDVTTLRLVLKRRRNTTLPTNRGCVDGIWQGNHCGVECGQKRQDRKKTEKDDGEELVQSLLKWTIRVYKGEKFTIQRTTTSQHSLNAHVYINTKLRCVQGKAALQHQAPASSRCSIKRLLAAGAQRIPEHHKQAFLRPSVREIMFKLHLYSARYCNVGV